MEIFGRYLLHQKVGAGGMAQIHLATRLGPRGFARPVAVKRILTSHAGEEEFVQAFLQEGRLGARLSHPNVVQVLEAGQVEGTYYLVMEFIHGADLRDMCKRFKRAHRHPPIAFTLNVIADLCSALHHVHEARDDARRPLHLVHRDISPHNLLVSHEGQVKLADFGIAKAADQGMMTRTGVIKGKVGYLAPEQIRGEAIDRRADVYQAGIVFYELLTGCHPFIAGSPTETMARILAGRTTRPRARRPEIPQVVEDCLRDALRPRASERYPTAARFQEAAEWALARLGLPRGPDPVRAQMALLYPSARPPMLATQMPAVVSADGAPMSAAPGADAQRPAERRTPPPARPSGYRPPGPFPSGER
jgi:eukaryotic-like serine/threonine-protein kinase